MKNRGILGHYQFVKESTKKVPAKKVPAKKVPEKELSIFQKLKSTSTSATAPQQAVLTALHHVNMVMSHLPSGAKSEGQPDEAMRELHSVLHALVHAQAWKPEIQKDDPDIEAMPLDVRPSENELEDTYKMVYERLPGLAKLYQNLGELLCRLSRIPDQFKKCRLEQIPAAVAYTMNSALITLLQSSVRNINVIHKLDVRQLRKHARYMLEFPVLVHRSATGYSEVTDMIASIQLSDAFGDDSPSLRTKRDIFAAVASEIMDALSVIDEDLTVSIKNWKGIRQLVRNEILDLTFSKAPALEALLVENIDSKSDRGKPGRTKVRIKDRILERMATLSGLQQRDAVLAGDAAAGKIEFLKQRIKSVIDPSDAPDKGP